MLAAGGLALPVLPILDCPSLMAGSKVPLLLYPMPATTRSAVMIRGRMRGLFLSQEGVVV
jgi:hypothetical protein